MQRIWKMLGVLSGLMFVSMWIVVAGAVAQTLSTNAPAPEKAYEILLKVLFPALWTVGGPWLTGLVTSGFVFVPKFLQVIISTVVSAIAGALAGLIPDFPLGVESAVEFSASGGATGQVLANFHPDTLRPKTTKVAATGKE